MTEKQQQNALVKYTNWLEKAGLDTKEHQLEAMRWCLAHEMAEIPIDGIRGGLLADEMGLGKTIVALGLIISNFRPSTLIVVPRSLLDQWKRVIELYFGHEPLVYHGAGIKKKKASLLDPTKRTITLTTYGIIQTRREESPLYDIHWSRLICDEAHHLRNEKKLFKGVMRLQATIKWMVTGTPIQNRSTDLIALCRVLRLISTRSPAPSLSAVKSIIFRHSLRRTKAEVGITLPPVETTLINVPWLSEEEQDFCKQIHAQVSFPRVTLQNVNRILAFLGGCSLAWFTRLRQVSILPHLLQPTLNKLIAEGIVDNDMNLGNIRTTSKMTAVVKKLHERKKNHRRKLVFCHYHGEIDLLKGLLNKIGISTTIIDGRASAVEKRFSTLPMPTESDVRTLSKMWGNIPTEIYATIAGFMTPDVCLVQIQTGSEGLNLQHFQEIYFTSPWWNPALEDQAIARSHRIGQNQKVEVFRFAMENFGGQSVSLDQYCMRVQEKKRQLMGFFKKN
jgi:SNF2 family DNA or RNA helicase